MSSNAEHARTPITPPNAACSPNGRPLDQAWVDRVADDVSEVLTAEALELELVVFYDKVTETLHAVGYDGAPARFFRSLEQQPHHAAPSDCLVADGEGSRPSTPLPG